MCAHPVDGGSAMSTPARVNIGKAAPGAYKAVLGLEAEVRSHVTATGLEPRLVELIKIRTSQLNGCAFCLDMHTRDAMKAGETIERLAVLPAWRETTFFTERERAALLLAEAVTHIADGGVPDDVYRAAATALSADEIAAATWVAVLINAWNRIAISSRYHVGPK